MTMTEPMPYAGPRPAAVVADDLHKTYGTDVTAVHALRGVSVRLEPGRMTAIMGPSGSGKSTLLHCLAGLDVATTGTVRIADRDLAELSDTELTVLRRDRVGFVFQQFNLIPTMTAAENIALPFVLARRRPDPAWIDSLVATVGLADRLVHRPSELSGGQQQRVAIARALATRPDVVFADEPTGNLDSHVAGEILALLRHAVDSFGQCVALVTHDPLAASFADEVLFLGDGLLVDRMDQPTPARVLDRMKAFGG
jgi:putative ABC transport system ATP-binding protein